MTVDFALARGCRARPALLGTLAGAALCAMPLAAAARPTCADVLAQLGKRLADATCVDSPDLTTNNPLTTPADNSIPGLPVGAFTPTTDRAVIAPGPGKRTPITKVVPGLQIQARIADDPSGEARFLLRLPYDWNGRLVVAGASGTRSEFNGDYAWSDYVVQEGYAYASQNKGVYNLRIASTDSATPPNDLACRLNPASRVWVDFYDNEKGQHFTRWRDFMVEGGRLARAGVQAAYGREPRQTYAVGTSNGGYQVRRAVETAPEVFSGGVDWEGTYVDEHAPNLLTDLPAGVLNFPDYQASGNDPNSTAARNLRAAGYPPDIVLSATQTLWTSYWGSFWEVTLCQWQKRLDPGYDTYAAGTANYNYVARLSASEVGQRMDDFATSGRILRPLITIAGTMDGLLPIDHHARAYARAVAAKSLGHDRDRDAKVPGRLHPAYRLYEVQNGNHIETYQDTYSQLELIEPHAQHAFDLLAGYVESNQPLPPDQCIPRHGEISSSPAQPGHCTNLFEP